MLSYELNSSLFISNHFLLISNHPFFSYPDPACSIKYLNLAFEDEYKQLIKGFLKVETDQTQEPCKLERPSFEDRSPDHHQDHQDSFKLVRKEKSLSPVHRERSSSSVSREKSLSPVHNEKSSSFVRRKRSPGYVKNFLRENSDSENEYSKKQSKSGCSEMSSSRKSSDNSTAHRSEAKLTTKSKNSGTSLLAGRTLMKLNLLKKTGSNEQLPNSKKPRH